MNEFEFLQQNKPPQIQGKILNLVERQCDDPFHLRT